MSENLGGGDFFWLTLYFLVLVRLSLCLHLSACFRADCMNATQISTQLSPLNYWVYSNSRSNKFHCVKQTCSEFESTYLSENLSDLFRKQRLWLVSDDIVCKVLYCLFKQLLNRCSTARIASWTSSGCVRCLICRFLRELLLNSNGKLCSFTIFYARQHICYSTSLRQRRVRLSVRHTPVLCLAQRKQDREMYIIW